MGRPSTYSRNFGSVLSGWWPSLLRSTTAGRHAPSSHSALPVKTADGATEVQRSLGVCAARTSRKACVFRTRHR